MGIRKYKPTTPARRGSSVADFAEVTRSTPEKSLLRPLPQKGGRNNPEDHHPSPGRRPQAGLPVDRLPPCGQGRVPAKVAHIEYDPNRTSRIAPLHYADGEKRYILAPQNLRQGDRIETGQGADIKPGNNLPLRYIPTGTVVHAVEMRPGGGARSPALPEPACSWSPRMALRTAADAVREIRNVDLRCRATIGEVGNSEQSNINWGKAGRNRWKGKRPTVRGVAMNPVDHPHGGGEGKTSGGRHLVNPKVRPKAVPARRRSRATSSSSAAVSPARSAEEIRCHAV